MKDPKSKYDEARSIPDLYEIVKEIVKRELGHSRAGLMLLITDLGMESAGFIGATYTPGSNAIIVNRQALEFVKAARPDMYKPYVFHILLHEYLHSVGYTNEGETRKISKEISANTMGKCHPAAKFSANFESIFRVLSKPLHECPPRDRSYQVLESFDRSSSSYFQ